MMICFTMFLFEFEEFVKAFMVDEEFKQMVWRVFEDCADANSVGVILIHCEGSCALSLPDESRSCEQAVEEGCIDLVKEFDKVWIALFYGLFMLVKVFDKTLVEVYIKGFLLDTKEACEEVLDQADDYAWVNVFPGMTESERDMSSFERCRRIVWFEPFTIRKCEGIGWF